MCKNVQVRIKQSRVDMVDVAHGVYITRLWQGGGGTITFDAGHLSKSQG